MALHRETTATATRGDARALLARVLREADIELDGTRPWDLRVLDERAPAKILRLHNLGMGEAYMDGWVECERWDELATRVAAADLIARAPKSATLVAYGLQGALLNLGARRRAFEIGRRHYDIGNDLYERMLDARMTYSCGYWRDATTLDEAQEAKLELICRKLGLAPGMRVLDIGCGWGSFLRYAAQRHGVTGVGVTVSREQARFAERACAGLPVTVRLQDYRALDEPRFDRVVSIGMFEHVVHHNYATFMDVARRHVTDDGLFLLHTIGGLRSARRGDPWIDKYIFPNSMLPSMAQIARAVERRFVIEDVHNFGADYDRTLMAWHANVSRAWGDLADRYDERFRRMWSYYLLISAGGFRARATQLYQVVLSPRGVPGGYRSVR